MSEPSSPPASSSSIVEDVVTPSRPFRFNFEPRKGPESVSGATEGGGRGDFGAPPRLVLFNSTTSSLAVAALPEEWSSSKHGFHAISTVLNNPHKTQAPPKAHSYLPAVPPAELPRVRRKDFDTYLRAVAPEWDKFVRNVELGREGAAQLSQEAPYPRSQKPLPDLNTVPSVFLDPSFNLGDPRTFALVTEQDESDTTSDPSSLSYSLPLLEKFSHYADTVEQHLVREISQRSTSFFAALTNLHDLQSESEQCLDRISKLRVLLKDVDDKSAKRGMEIVQRELKVANMGKAKEGVAFVGSVVEMTALVKSLVVGGQWSEALGALDSLKAMWDVAPTEPPSLPPSTGGQRLLPTLEESEESEAVNQAFRVPLSSLKAFASLPEHLRLLTMDIASSLASELVNVLRTDLQTQFRNDENAGSIRLSLKDRLRPILIGLLRTKGLKEATLSWREIAFAEIRFVVNQEITAFQDSEEQGSDTGLPWVEHVRSMSQIEFLDLLKRLFATFLRGINALRDHASILVEMLQELQASSEDMAFSEEELADICSSATELSNSLAAKVMSKRSEQHAALTLFEFYTLFNEAWDFVVQCEVLCRRMIVGLRGVIVSQSKVFLQAFHQERLTQSARLVEDEMWSPVEIPPSLQAVVDIIIDSAVHNPSKLIFKTAANGITNGSDHATPSSPDANGTQLAKHIHIEDRAHFSVSATNQAIILLQDYLQVIFNLNTLTTDAMSRVIEFLKSFNSRTCQVVLGAGAMRSAGLKNITAKHLALASQSLTIMISLIPYVREAFRRHLSSKQAVMLVEFDKLKRDYQEHQNEIHAKLIAIMGDRLNTHIQSLQAVNWEAPRSGDGVNGYMQLLVKETVLLHKVLSRYLAVPVVQYVMTQVFAAINHRLSEEYHKMELPNQEAKDRLLADARFLHQNFATLKNVTAQSAMLETVITEKSAGRRAQPPPVSNIPVSGITRSNTLSSANARLKGLLSGRKSTSPIPEPVDKPLPSPTPAAPMSEFPQPEKVLPSPVLSTSPPPVQCREMDTTPGTVSEQRSGFFGAVDQGENVGPLVSSPTFKGRELPPVDTLPQEGETSVAGTS